MKLLVLFLCVLSLSACNIFSPFDSPQGDAQNLEAARACFDAGNYACAQQYYDALSSSDNDIKISELALLTLAENNILSIKDLISSFGSGTGNGSSLAFLAGTLYSRGKDDATTRATIQSVFQSADGIANAQLQAFVQFISSVAMLNSILAVTVDSAPPDGGLSQGDLVKTPSGCNTNSCTLNTSGVCNGPNGAIADSGGSYDMNSASGWTDAPNLVQLNAAITAAVTAANNLSPNSTNGLVSTLSQLGSLVVTDAPCYRAGLVSVLF